MKIFFDTEFTGLRKDTTLISVGMIAEDGQNFYGILTDYDKTQCNDWINENVIANLHNAKADFIGTKEELKVILTKFLSQFDSVQFISDVAHFDFVLFIDVYGSAFDLPPNVSPVCFDLNQLLARRLGVTYREAFDLNREELAGLVGGSKHNAFWDACIIRKLYEKYK